MRILVHNTRPVMVKAGGHYFRARSRTPVDVDAATARQIEAQYGLGVQRPASASAPGRPAETSSSAGTEPSPAVSQLPGPPDVTSLACPDCEFVAKSAIGLVSHRRAKHKEA
jgi:hypothetical protein